MDTIVTAKTANKNFEHILLFFWKIFGESNWKVIN
jgi:hypothetical protein